MNRTSPLLCHQVSWSVNAWVVIKLVSILTLVVFAGCQSQSNESPPSSTATSDAAKGLAQVGDEGNRLASPHKEAQLQMMAVGISIHEFHEQHQRVLLVSEPMPLGSQEGERFSWRVALLPFLHYWTEDGTKISYQELYDRFRFDEPWDSPHNLEIAATIPEPYQYGSDDKLTQLMMVTGPGLFSEADKAFNLYRDFQRGGTDGTIGWYLIEPTAARIWTQPDDPTVIPAEFADQLDPDQPLIMMASGRVEVVKEAMIGTLAEQLPR